MSDEKIEFIGMDAASQPDVTALIELQRGVIKYVTFDPALIQKRLNENIYRRMQAAIHQGVVVPTAKKLAAEYRAIKLNTTDA